MTLSLGHAGRGLHLRRVMAAHRLGGYGRKVIAFLTTTDSVKLSAVEAVLAGAGLAPRVFDRAMNGLYGRALPLRLMLEEDEVPAARLAMRSAGFTEAGDGDWDLAPLSAP